MILSALCLALAVCCGVAAHAQNVSTLAPVETRDRKIIRRWKLDGDPRGIAVGKDGTVYVGLAETQEVVAIDPKTGAVKNRVVLDSADIAATKELVTLRTSGDQRRLFIANGSDESVTILSLPDLGVIREITLEGEPVRDAVPDPKGRFVYVLGRRVHVFDGEGKKELRKLPMEDPMAIAASADAVAVVGSEVFADLKATIVALYDTTNFAELTRDPLETTATIGGALFANNSFIAIGSEHVFERPLARRGGSSMQSDAGGTMRMRIDFGDLVNSDRVCFPKGAGPQIAVSDASENVLIIAERRCTESGSFTGSRRRVTPASIYGIDAYALAFDRLTNSVAATDRKGFLTIYKVPSTPVVK